MSTSSQWANAVARDIGRLINGEISQEDFATAMAVATRDWTVSTSDIQELAAQVSSFLMRLQSFIVWDGPPPENIGGLGTWCMNRLTGDIYGPKTAAGWGEPAFSLVGPAGASALAIVIAAGDLPENATPADFATWLADSQIAKVQPFVDAAATSATSAASDAGAAQTAATAAGEARTGAETAQAAVAGAADATAADRVATGADRAAVAEDRAAVEAAALATAGHANDAASAAGVSVAAKDLAEGAASAAGASAAATADDALATAADREAVADDKAAVAADRAAAEAAAQTATSEAGAASGHADNADSARIAAEAAQAAAEQARDEAEAIAGGDFVTGPTSSTDGRLAVFAGTSGKAVKEGPAFGVGAPGDVLRRSDGDDRYRAAGDVPLAEVTGLDAALTDIDGALTAQAQAIAGKQDDLGFTPADAADTYTKGEVDAALEEKADLVDGKVPLEQLPAMSGGGLEVGDILTTARNPGSKYLSADGASYLRTAWPELSPMLPDGGSQPFTAWTARTLPAGNWYAVAYGNGVFVAVARGSNVAATSPDGMTWTQQALPTSANWQSITYGGGHFIAIANNSAIAATSPDGITWTQRALPVVAYWRKVTFGAGMFLAVADSGNIAATSPDGIVWTQRTLPASGSWASCAYGNGVFVALLSGSSIAATSPDGITWTQRTAISGNWDNLTYGNGRFVAVSSANVAQAITSPDGISWTGRTLPATAYWQSVSFGNGMFLATASATVSATSPDGITWTQRTLPSAGNWAASAYGDGRFVAIIMGAGSTSGASSNRMIDPTLFIVPLVAVNDPAKAYIKGEA